MVTGKDVILTPWCPRSNRVLVHQFSAHHFGVIMGSLKKNDEEE